MHAYKRTLLYFTCCNTDGTKVNRQEVAGPV